MERTRLIDLIFTFSKERTAFESLESRFANIDKTGLLKNILECGVLPEMFSHDSTEEKLWAKYSDILLSKSFEFLGLKSQVIRVRGDSADVLAEASNYKIVGDAKTFRLSRTAKNQKDFKVESLDSWRRTNDYAVLVGPLCHFPNTASAIYRQAISKNVTLFSFAHLHFMLQHYHSKVDIEPVWNIGKTCFSDSNSNLKSANSYWTNLDNTILSAFNKTRDDLLKSKMLDTEATRKLAEEGILYWENRIEEYKKLSKDEAIKRLLKAEKIEAKIEQIKKNVSSMDTEVTQ